MTDDVEILVVEDNEADEDLTLHALASDHLANRVFVARDGAEALEFLFGGQTDPRESKLKLILLDLKLPKVGGVEVLRRVKEDLRTRHVPVVILSSSREEGDLKSCYDYGANSYVVKPIDFELYMKSVSETGAYWLTINALPV